MNREALETSAKLATMLRRDNVQVSVEFDPDVHALLMKLCHDNRETGSVIVARALRIMNAIHSGEAKLVYDR